MDPVSVAANAENRSKTLAYQTVSGYTTKVTIIDTQRPNPDNVQAITAMKRFRQKWIAVNPLHTLVLGVTQHQTIEQCKMALVFGLFLQLQCLKEGSYLKIYMS
jgi:ABC-type protease/lipase transport system fused ATPase/permease subunit